MSDIDRVQLIGLSGIPLVKAGDSITELVISALQKKNLQLQAGDILVLAQKIISKAEGRLVRLADINPSSDAILLGKKTAKDPRLAELILQESVRILRAKPGVTIVEHRLGLIHANAGIDQSNILHDEEDDCALLLPLDPDQSALTLRVDLQNKTGATVAVLISDSTGRPWRLGTVPIVIGAAGLAVLIDHIGELDLFGRPLQATTVGLGDQIASAAGLLMGETKAACPAVLVRGLVAPEASSQNASHLLRQASEDLFR